MTVLRRQPYAALPIGVTCRRLTNAAAADAAGMAKCPVSALDDANSPLTQRLKEALSLVDIRTLDHFVIGGVESVSFAE